MDKELLEYIDSDTVEMAVDFFEQGISGISINPADIKSFADSYRDVLTAKNKWTDELQASYDKMKSYFDIG